MKGQLNEKINKCKWKDEYIKGWINKRMTKWKKLLNDYNFMTKCINE